MGTVYRAEQLTPVKRTVAVTKLLKMMGLLNIGCMRRSGFHHGESLILSLIYFRIPTPSLYENHRRNS